MVAEQACACENRFILKRRPCEGALQTSLGFTVDGAPKQAESYDLTERALSDFLLTVRIAGFSAQSWHDSPKRYQISAVTGLAEKIEDMCADKARLHKYPDQHFLSLGGVDVARSIGDRVTSSEILIINEIAVHHAYRCSLAVLRLWPRFITYEAADVPCAYTIDAHLFPEHWLQYICMYIYRRNSAAAGLRMVFSILRTGHLLELEPLVLRGRA